MEYRRPPWLQEYFCLRGSGIDDDHVLFSIAAFPPSTSSTTEDYVNLGYWHTAKDTLDKVSPRSIAIVGHVILESVNELQQKFH